MHCYGFRGAAKLNQDHLARLCIELGAHPISRDLYRITPNLTITDLSTERLACSTILMIRIMYEAESRNKSGNIPRLFTTILPSQKR
jgi:hypothetical protein